MPNLTPFLSLVKPLETEDYDINVHNGNSDILDTILSNHDSAILQLQAALYRSGTVDLYPVDAAEFRSIIETTPKKSEWQKHCNKYA